MGGLAEFLTKLGPARIAAMGAVTLALIGFFAFVIMRVSQPNMGVLYADLSLEDSSAMLRDLDQRLPVGMGRHRALEVGADGLLQKRGRGLSGGVRVHASNVRRRGVASEGRGVER